MGTKNDPGIFDCYADAEPDEPIFVLRAKDASAPMLVRMWAFMRLLLIEADAKPMSDLDACTEANRCAMAMEQWREHQKTGAA